MKDILEKGLDVANKGMDLVNKVYDDGLSKPIQTFGNGLDKCLKFMGAIVYPSMYEYTQNAEYKLKEIDRKLAEKYHSIPEDKQVNPRMNIMGPAVELLKYNLDEQHIKDIFVNIMTNEMNLDKQSKVLPSYIEVVKQLSKDDAFMLKSIYDLYKRHHKNNYALIIIRLKSLNPQGGYTDIDKYIIGDANKEGNYTSLHTIKLKPIIFDNLTRLELVKTYDMVSLTNKEIYEIAFSSLKSKYTNIKENYELIYEKGLFEITEYGLKFLEICFE